MVAWYPCWVPGSHAGCWFSSASMTGSHDNASVAVMAPSTPASPAWWLMMCATVISSLPLRANAGQYSATGADTSNRPSWASRLAQMAVAPLVVENTSMSVSSCQGAPVSTSATPPQRSTTLLPRW